MDLLCFHIPRFSAWSLSQRWCVEGGPSSPVVVCAGRRVVSFVDDRLSRRGLAVGDRVDRARRLVPEAQFLLRDAEVEHALWESILGRLYRLTPQVQPLPNPLRPVPQRRRPDARRVRSENLFAALRQTDSTDPVTSLDGLWDNGAWAILQGPFAAGLPELTTELGARAGRSHRRCWAMLAAAYSEPGQITTVPEHMIAPFLRQAPVTLLQKLCFDAELVERLHLFGLQSIGHIFGLSRRQLVAQFGREGQRLFDLLHPDDFEPAVGPYDPRTLSASREFDWPLFEPGDLQPVLYQLLEQLQAHLQGRGVRHLEVRLHGRRRTDRTAQRILRDPTHRRATLRVAADALLMQALTESGGRRKPVGRGVDRLSLTMCGLTRVASAQSELFPRRPDLKPLVRSVEARFPGKLVRPVHVHADPFFPEEEYRFESIAH